MTIKNNISEIERAIGHPSCRLIAVSKTQPLAKIREAYDAGHRLFGENKVQEMIDKHAALPPDIEWHLIGHLQTNKVKYIAPFVSLIHSVDSDKLLTEINKQGAKINRIIPCLIQVHIAREETKFGTDESTIFQWLTDGLFEKLPFVQVVGLMGMASNTSDHDQIRHEFQTLRQLFERLKLQNTSSRLIMKELSMGMSSDYPLAVQEGSTMIRVGTAIFGERDYPAETKI